MDVRCMVYGREREVNLFPVVPSRRRRGRGGATRPRKAGIKVEGKWKLFSDFREHKRERVGLEDWEWG